MSTIKDGGSAFPVVGMSNRNGQEFEAVFEFGMTLRDHFAAEAMNGIWASPDVLSTLPKNREAETIANMAYEQADAMLAVRKVQP